MLQLNDIIDTLKSNHEIELRNVTTVVTLQIQDKLSEKEMEIIKVNKKFSDLQILNSETYFIE